MIVSLNLDPLTPDNGHSMVSVTLEPKERYYSESVLWYHLKETLNKAGGWWAPLIKTNHEREGDLYGSREVYCLRTTARKKRGIKIYDDQYAIEFIYKRLKERGTIELPVLIYGANETEVINPLTGKPE